MRKEETGWGHGGERKTEGELRLEHRSGEKDGGRG